MLAVSLLASFRKSESTTKPMPVSEPGLDAPHEETVVTAPVVAAETAPPAIAAPAWASEPTIFPIAELSNAAEASVATAQAKKPCAVSRK